MFCIDLIGCLKNSFVIHCHRSFKTFLAVLISNILYFSLGYDIREYHRVHEIVKKRKNIIIIDYLRFLAILQLYLLSVNLNFNV